MEASLAQLEEISFFRGTFAIKMKQFKVRFSIKYSFLLKMDHIG
jgi:hypothetical protein